MAEVNVKPLQDSLEEYSFEGVEVLRSTSSLAAHAVLYITVALLLSAITWAFVTKADVVITTQGKLVERTEPTKIYSPVEGELIEMFVSEGVPVSEGDLLARIKSAQAIQIAAAVIQAELNLQALAEKRKNFPQEKELIERELASLAEQVELLTAEYEREKSDGLQKLTDAQKRQLEMLRLQVEEKRQAVVQAEDKYQRFKRLHESQSGGGISRQQLIEQQNAFEQAEAQYKQVLGQIEDAELEFAAQHVASRQKIEKLQIDILTTSLKSDQKRSELELTEKEIEMKYTAALETYKAASRINFADLDENNFLAIRAPVSGEITGVSYKQPGEQVAPAKPVASISPKNSGKVVAISVLDRDRGMLHVGQSVKIKFHAFPYQRFGFVTGKLIYLSRNAELNSDGQSLYKGTVSIDRDHYVVDGTVVPIRFGMNAKVEIVTQRRRLLDFIVDPFRKVPVR